MIQQEDITRIIKILREDAKPKKIILFGSGARGDSKPDSDADFLVVEESVSDRAGEMVRLRRLLSSLRIPVDIVVVSESAFRKWRTTPGNLFYEASIEGKLLYEVA